MTAPRKDGQAVRHLTIADLAEREAVKVETVYCWISRGQAPQSMGRGTGRRFRLADVEAWELERLNPRMTQAQAARTAA